MDNVTGFESAAVSITFQRSVDSIVELAKYGRSEKDQRIIDEWSSYLLSPTKLKENPSQFSELKKQVEAMLEGSVDICQNVTETSIGLLQGAARNEKEKETVNNWATLIRNPQKLKNSKPMFLSLSQEIEKSFMVSVEPKPTSNPGIEVD
jgi:hypothetical protein